MIKEPAKPEEGSESRTQKEELATKLSTESRTQKEELSTGALTLYSEIFTKYSEKYLNIDYLN